MKNPLQHTKKAYTILVILIFIGNLINVPYSLSQIKDDSSSSDKNSDEDFSPYVGYNCTKLGEYDTNYGKPNEMIISELNWKTYAFIREDLGILVLDVSNPEYPTYVNHLFPREHFISFTVSGELMILMSVDKAFFFYDIRDIFNPVLIFSSPLDGPYYYIYNLVVSDDVFYFTDAGRGLVAYNISNPSNPQYLGRYENPSHSNWYDDIKIVDNLVYLCADYTFQIVNFSDFLNPTLVGIFLANRTSSNFHDILLQDDKAYLCTTYGGFYILDISNKTNPTKITNIWDLNYRFYDFYLNESVGYLLTSGDGLVLLNLTDLANISYLQKAYNYGYYRSLGVHKDYLILLDYYEGIKIYKIKQDKTIEFVTRFWDGGTGFDVVVRKNIAFVANGYNGLEIYKIKNSLTPEFLSRVYLRGSCVRVLVHKNMVYVRVLNKDEIYVVDVSNPKKPKFLGSFELEFTYDNKTYSIYFFEIINNQLLAYCANSSNLSVAILEFTNTTSVEVIDIIPVNSYVRKIFYNPPYLYVIQGYLNLTIYYKNDSNWEQLANIEIQDSFRDTYVYEQFAYFATYNDLLIYDLRDPANPVLADVFHGYEDPYQGYDRVVVEGDYAYLIEERNKELQFLNVEDKYEPYIEGYFQCNDSLMDVFVEDKVVYLTGYFVNIEIIQLDKFITLLNYVIYTPIAGMVAIIGVPIIIGLSFRAIRRRKAAKSTPTTDLLPREEIHDSTPETENDSPLSVSPDDFDDPKLLALAKKIFEAAEEDSK